jgi:VIT1/CCC1 family predicted Fe2+/Mn2+ transporter
MSDRHSLREHFVGYMRNFIFGVEDSLVSTVGLLSGVAVGGVTRQTILLTGIVLIFVEAFSMGVGSFLSEQSAEESISRQNKPDKFSSTAALIMFTSYFLAGFIPLSPYLFWPPDQAFYFSIGASLLGLMILGLISSRVLKINMIRATFRMVVIGAVAVGIGVVVGIIFQA